MPRSHIKVFSNHSASLPRMEGEKCSNLSNFLFFTLSAPFTGLQLAANVSIGVKAISEMFTQRWELQVEMSLWIKNWLHFPQSSDDPGDTGGHKVRPRVVFIWRLGYKGLDLSQSQECSVQQTSTVTPVCLYLVLVVGGESQRLNLMKKPFLISWRNLNLHLLLMIGWTGIDA